MLGIVVAPALLFLALFLVPFIDRSPERAPLRRPLANGAFTAVWLYGLEEGSLIANGTRSARFTGGFTQLDYTPMLPLTFGTRYDGVYNLRQADPSQPSNSNQQQGLTVFARYSLWMPA